MARDGDNILIRDSADAFADAVLDVLSDSDLRVRLGRGGRTSAETEYDWRKIGDEMLSAYEALASRHESR
jgi:glycosyltransferase involved in cell wall biosynthesis